MGAPWWSLDDAARRAGHFRWLELRLFEVLGGWVQAIDHLEAKRLVHVHSFRHAAHAEIWRTQLPAPGELGADDLTRPESGAVAALVEGLGKGSPTEGTAAYYGEVLPSLVDRYRAAAGEAGGPADGPLGRHLRVMVAALDLALDEGRRLLAGDPPGSPP